MTALDVVSGGEGVLFVEALRRHARECPDRVALTWLRDLREPVASLTYRELDVRAAAVGARVRERVSPGDRVLLVYPPGLEFTVAFAGCLYAGCVPVPVHPALDRETGAAVVGRIAADSGAALALTADEATAATAGRVLGVDALWQRDADRPVSTEPVPPDPGAPAFLQYTSGSTGDPKGVVVTHANLVANLDAIARAFEHDPTAVVLSWLPTYHDMGLIGNILHPLYHRVPAYLAAPGDFVRHPVDWLRAIADFGVTTSGAPNFAYDLVVRALRRAPAHGLDLSGWRRAYSGAEPVAESTLDQFAELLTPAGFRPDAFVPCYGLAEATLLVTAARPGSGPRARHATDRTRAVSCGVPHGCDVVVVDGADPLPAGQIGEILVKGPSVAAGYWGRPETSREVFGATVTGRGGGWLRTGDLGFLVDEELHVTGRRKDVIVLRGRNIFPQDIEHLAVRTVPALRPGAVVAFEDPDRQGVVVVGEARGGRLDPADRDRLAVELTADFGVPLADLVGVARGRVPKTTSGKLRRVETARRYRAGEYDQFRPARAGSAPSAPSAPPSQARLRQVVEDVLGVPVPVPTQPLASYGMDSLAALRLSAELASELGVDVPVRELVDGAGVADLVARVGARSGPEPPSVADGSGGGRLTPAQEALTFLQLLDPTSDEYNISFAWELDPETDVAAFDAALRTAVGRQPELATLIVTDGDTRRRETVPPERMAGVLALVPTPVREERLAEQLADAAATPFQLDQGPLFRLYLWQAGGRRVYQLVAHHVVTDLWSLGLLLRDTAESYTALRHGGTGEAPPRPGYDHYRIAQQHYLASPAAAARDEQLRSVLPARGEAVQVPTDRPRGSRRSPRAGRVGRTVPLPPDGSAGVADRVALLAALWAACLHRYGTPNPVVVGMPVVGRPSGRLAEVGGLCTNTVPLAVQVDPRQRLADLVAEVRRQVTAGLDEGMYPLSRAVRAVRPERVPGRLPLVETMVTVQENPLPEVPGLLDALAGEPAELAVGDLRLRSMPLRPRSCRYDLDLVVTPRPDGYQLTLDYAADLFGPATAEAVLDTYAAMVAAAHHRDASQVADVFVLSAGDRELARRFGGGDHPALRPPLLDRLRAVGVERPDAPAVVTAERTIDFAGFVDRMDGLAAALRRAVAGDAPEAGPTAVRAGTGARQQVGLLLESPADFTVGMFGAWAAGLGVLPLPVEFPDARLGDMLADCAPALLLTAAASAPRAASLLAELRSAPRLVLFEDLLAGDRAGPPPAPPPTAPAYTVYTSGSTGRPKGVLIRHDQLAYLLAWEGRSWELGPWVRMAQTLSLGFDFGLQELFTALPFGGCVVVPTAADRVNARAYARFLRRERVTVLFTTPSYADQLVAAGEPMPTLRLVLLGGEVLTRATVEGLRRLVGQGCRLVNGYGPTEATVNCLAYELPDGGDERSGATPLPVGAPSGAARVRLVDEYGLPVPSPAVGELVIGGPGVAEGYLHRPGESAERFTTDPATRERTYRSGDLAWLDPASGFVVVGRADRQVKVRGFRTELGEVEHLLRRQPGVTGCAVLMVEQPRRLVAVVSGAAVDPSALGAAVAAHLPAAMVPEQVVVVDELPVTPNGKLDEPGVRRLAQQELVEVLPDSATRHDVEAAVCRVWADALALPAVSPDANVFDAGAHSLVVTRVHHHLQVALGLTFPVHYLFEYPRPRDLAGHLAGQRRTRPVSQAESPPTAKEES